MKKRSKSQTRKMILKERLLKSPEARISASKSVITLLKKYINQNNFKKIFLYYEMGGEISVRELLFGIDSEIVCGLPCVSTETNLVFKKYEWDYPVRKNRFNIYEPESTATVLHATEDTLVVVPCVGVSKEKYRLGNGGGYYDRFMSKNPQANYVGIVYFQHRTIDFEVEFHDQKLDYVISEKTFQ